MTIAVDLGRKATKKNKKKTSHQLHGIIKTTKNHVLTFYIELFTRTVEDRVSALPC